MKPLLLFILLAPLWGLSQGTESQFLLNGTFKIYSPNLTIEKGQVHISSQTYYNVKGFNRHSIGIMLPIKNVMAGLQIKRTGDEIYSKNQFSASTYLSTEQWMIGGVLTFNQEHFEGYKNRNTLNFGATSTLQIKNYLLKGNVRLASDSTQTSSINLGIGYTLEHFTPFVQSSFKNQTPYQTFLFGILYHTSLLGFKIQIDPLQKSLCIQSSFSWNKLNLVMGVGYSIDVQYTSEIQGCYAW